MKSAVFSAVLGLLVINAHVACSEDKSSGASKDAGGDALAPLGYTEIPKISCGSDGECPAPEDTVATYGVISCCTTSNICGFETPLSPGECLEPGQPGGISDDCADFVSGSVLELQGCCRPDGKCGGMDTFMGLGCVAMEDYGEPGASCTFDAAEQSCQYRTEYACDGPEDCGAGQMCCGAFTFGVARYLDFGCFDSCEDAQAAEEGSGSWREVCHPQEGCSNAEQVCVTFDGILPEGLAVCRDTGDAAPSSASVAADEIVCGGGTCGAAEKCCVRDNGDSYCIAESEACSCQAP